MYQYATGDNDSKRFAPNVQTDEASSASQSHTSDTSATRPINAGPYESAGSSESGYSAGSAAASPSSWQSSTPRYGAPDTYTRSGGTPQGQYSPWTPQQQNYGPQGSYWNEHSPQQVYTEIESNGLVALILSIVSFFTLGILLSVPMWIWSQSMINKGRRAGLPFQAMSRARIARGISIVVTAIYILLGVICVVLGIIVAMTDSQI